jgi:hypothetical protein
MAYEKSSFAMIAVARCTTWIPTVTWHEIRYDRGARSSVLDGERRFPAPEEAQIFAERLAASKV